MLTSNQRSQMQHRFTGLMLDAGRPLTKSVESTDAYNNPVYGEVEGAEIACGFDPTASREVSDGSEVVITDAILRLPLSQETAIQAISRWKLTKRHGTALATPQLYDIVGLPQRGPSGLVLTLKLSTRPDTETK